MRARYAFAGQAAAYAAAAVAVVLLPRFVSGYHELELARVGIFFIAILGLQILTGFTGQISLGHSAFMAVGGYTTAILAARHGVPLLATLPLAGLVAGAVGLAFGLPALRLSGLYLALATFAVAVAAPALPKKFKDFTGGSTGILLPLHTNRWYYVVTWSCAGVLLPLAWLLSRGKLGRAFRAVRDSEVAAASSGVNLALYKTLAFGISSFYAGVAGALLALVSAFANPNTFPVTLSLDVLVGLVVGGLGSLWGCILGAAFVQYLPQIAQHVSDQAPDVIRGGLLVLLMFVIPGGVAGAVRRLASRAVDD
jgi:branched-chain amino acid transport system permease protein